MSNYRDNVHRQISMPRRCARCGVTSIGGTWPIYSQYNYTFYIVAATYKTSRFPVPVCDSCKMYMDQDSSTWRNVFFASLVSMVIFLFLASTMPKYFSVFIGLTFLAGIVFFFSMLRRAKYYGTSGIGNFDGKYFVFFNKDFHHEFAELNPELVRDR